MGKGHKDEKNRFYRDFNLHQGEKKGQVYFANENSMLIIATIRDNDNVSGVNYVDAYILLSEGKGYRLHTTATKKKKETAIDLIQDKFKDEKLTSLFY